MRHSSAGDPEGRRLARNQASVLADAGQVARVMQVLLDRADFDDNGTLKKLIRDLAGEERQKLQKSIGYIESRRKFKPHVSHPLLEKRPRSNLYLDENGISNREPQGAPNAPIFALGAVALPRESVDDYVVAADEIKLNFFGTTDITFHEPHMRRREVIFRFDDDVQKQKEFDQAIDKLVRDTNCVAFGVVVRKDAFDKEFVQAGLDPYLPTDVYALAIMMLLERYVDFLAFQSQTKRLGRLTFESIGPREDAVHQLEYARLLLDGSQWVPGKSFRSWLETGLRFEPKSGSHPLELSDMFSRDLYEWAKSGCTSQPKRWSLFSRKVYCRADGQMGKFGVKVFPATGLEERIQNHRRSYGAKT